jgi:hypothetical protein
MAQLLKGKQIAQQTITIKGATGNVVVQGDLDMSTYNVVISGTPTANNQAVNKAYVDAVAQGLIPHPPVKVVALTTVASLTGLTTVDGYSLSADDRVLLVNQGGTGVGDSDIQNGLWLAKAGAWLRPTDADGTPENEVALGDFVYVETGTTYTSSGWVLAGTDGNSNNNIEVGIEAQQWVQVSAPGQYGTDGEGIELVGNIFNLELDGSTLSKTSSGIRVAASVITVISNNQSNTTSLSTAISSELSTRGTADTSLSTAISGNTSATTSLSTAISTEVSTRTSTDSTLSTAISTETSTRNSVDVSLSTAINNSITGLTNGNGTTANGTAVNFGGILSDNTYIDLSSSTMEFWGEYGEIAMGRGISESGDYDYLGIDGLGINVTTENGQGIKYVADYSKTLLDNSLVNKGFVTGYTSGMTLNISSLSTAISTEASTRTSTDSTLSTTISTEASTRTSADTSLATGISTTVSTEASIRASADTSLSTEIAAITSGSTAGVDSLSTALSNEISTRGTADTSLSTTISTEASTRTSADSSLATAISNIQAPSYFEQLLTPAISGSSTAVNIGTAFAHGVTGGVIDESTVIVFFNGIEYTFEYVQGSPAVFHTNGVTPTSAGTPLYFDGVEAGFAIETTDDVKIKYVVTT